MVPDDAARAASPATSGHQLAPHRSGRTPLRQRANVTGPCPFGQNADMSVAILMGSSSDASIMDDAVQTLRSFGVPVEVRVLSAHRTPDDTMAFARGAAARGVKVIIAAAGGRPTWPAWWPPPPRCR